MEEWPAEGTNSAIHATFRASKGCHVKACKKTAQSSVKLEPFDLPGMVVIHQGPSNDLALSTTASPDSLFNIIQGLDGNQDRVSLESNSLQGCFLSARIGNTAGSTVRLECVSDSDPDMSFRQAASFTPITGLREYNPISFMAKGVRRNFVLEPLLSLKDETYSVYFDIVT